MYLNELTMETKDKDETLYFIHGKPVTKKNYDTHANTLFSLIADLNWFVKKCCTSDEENSNTN